MKCSRLSASAEIFWKQRICLGSPHQQVGHALGDALVWEALRNPPWPVEYQLRLPFPSFSFAAKAIKMGFKLDHIKYKQERRKTKVSERQGWPMRQAWRYPSSRTRVGISQLLRSGQGQSTGTWSCHGRLGRHQELPSPWKCCLQSCEGETQQSVRRTDLSLIY